MSVRPAPTSRRPHRPYGFFPPKKPFETTSDNSFLSKEEIIELYESRQYTFVLFDSIELPRYHCSFRFQQPIPKHVAYNLYGTNQQVTLLHQTSGKLIVLDGCRCYPIWKEGVHEKKLDTTVVMNVITEPRSLNNIQRLQLATYCNIKARDTQMSTMWEKVYVCFAFYSAFMDMDDRIGVSDGSRHTSIGTKPSICTAIGKGLYLSSLFDRQFPHPMRNKDIENIENLIRITVRGCIQLSIEDDLMKAITHFCAEAPSCSEMYFNRQFFYDYGAEWFHSAPLLTQIILLFVLPSFPYQINHEVYSIPTEATKGEVYARLRVRIPRICEQVSCFLWSYIFEMREKTREETGGSFIHEWKAERDLPLIRDIANEIRSAIYSAECDIMNGKVGAIGEELLKSVIESAKRSIMKYSVSISQMNIYLLLK